MRVPTAHDETPETPSRSQSGSPPTQTWPASGFQLGIATGQIPMSWALCDRSSTALIPRSRLDLALRQTIYIAGPLKSPPEAHRVTPSRSPRRHYASLTSVTRFPTRDHHRMGLVAVEGLQQFIHRADPSLETGRLWFPPRGSSGNTFVIATVSPRLRDWPHTVSDSGSRPYRLRCCGSSATVPQPR